MKTANLQTIAITTTTTTKILPRFVKTSEHYMARVHHQLWHRRQKEQQILDAQRALLEKRRASRCLADAPSTTTTTTTPKRQSQRVRDASALTVPSILPLEYNNPTLRSLWHGSQDRHRPPAPHWTNPDSGAVAPQIADLTEGEHLLLSRLTPFVNIIKFDEDFDIAPDIVEIRETERSCESLDGLADLAETFGNLDLIRPPYFKDDLADPVRLEPISSRAAISRSATIVRAQWHQGDVSIFNPHFAGAQCCAMAIGNIIRSRLVPLAQWTTRTLDTNMLESDKLYAAIRWLSDRLQQAVPPSGFLLVRNFNVIRHRICIFGQVCHLRYDQDPAIFGNLSDPLNVADGHPGVALFQGLRQLFARHSAGVLTANHKCYAVMRCQTANRFYLVDSHSCGVKGGVARWDQGRACAIECEHLVELVRVCKRATGSRNSQYTLDYVEVMFDDGEERRFEDDRGIVEAAQNVEHSAAAVVIEEHVEQTGGMACNQPREECVVEEGSCVKVQPNDDHHFYSLLRFEYCRLQSYAKRSGRTISDVLGKLIAQLGALGTLHWQQGALLDGVQGSDDGRTLTTFDAGQRLMSNQTNRTLWACWRVMAQYMARYNALQNAPNECALVRRHTANRIPRKPAKRPDGPYRLGHHRLSFTQSCRKSGANHILERNVNPAI